ncbi:MAG: IS200/IS605 family transposase [Parachlamydiaceae bacterium]|nr:IS200/IS605 family transposase [Parachlamydiaceae bacterium]
MTHTYSQLLFHLVWSTKERRPLILPDFKKALYEYMAGIFRSLKCYCLLIGGVEDHIHVCVEIPPSLNISDVMKTVKVSTTKWIKQNYVNCNDFEWQQGYGAFSVSTSNKNVLLEYIKNQEQHHKKVDFREEFLILLQKHGVKFEEKYLWK